MNTYTKKDIPNRPLRDSFTEATLHRAQTAKRRATKNYFIGVPFTMKKPFKSLRTATGVTLGFAAIAVSSVGVYALSNWFGGNPTVTEDASIMHLDLSSCKGPWLAGVGSTENRSDAQFKIVGNPHISASDLQQQLLIDCEFGAVNSFYNPGKTYDYQYTVTPATITAVTGRTFTISYSWENSTQQKTFTLTADAPIYVQGKAAQPTDFHPGDFIVAAVANSAHQYAVEGTDIFAAAPVYSVFKTQYDMSKASGATKLSGINYDKDNVMPLDLYNQAHSK